MLGWIGILGGLLLAVLPLLWLYLEGAFRPMPRYRLRGDVADADHFALSLASLSDSLPTSGTLTGFWGAVDDIQAARLAAIAQAQHLIQFETFIITPGRRAEALAAALVARSQAGVTVQVLVDAYGANAMAPAYWQRLRQAGVAVRLFQPFSWRDPLAYLRRNHRKLLIVDQQVALIGGAGISDQWDGHFRGGHYPPWFDFESRWQGPVVGLLTGFFWQHWLDAGGDVNLLDHQPLRSTAAEPAAIVVTPGEDPSPRDSPIRGLFHICVLAAKHRVWIASPYLLPDRATCHTLAQARGRGVDVRIVTMGPRSDKPLVWDVARSRYGRLLSAGVDLYEYQPSMMHAKVILIDQHWVSAGSANLDPRSFFHNDELNLCTCDRTLLASVEQLFEQAFAHSRLITPKQWRQRPLGQRLRGSLGNVLYWQL
ncbi:MAG: cardiolipin synthase B [Leptolyngbya sp.]|nr:cardiolipin synthase B [Leptolyngbya sp.]